jgi:acetate kinase
MVPGDAAVHMNDTQKIGYLLTGIRQEKSLDSVYVAIQQDQRRGTITFEDTCDDLHHRCEAIQADQLLYTQVKDTGRKLLVTTQGKRQNKDAPDVEKKECLEKDCTEMIKSYLPLCPLHYHQCVSGKTPALELKNGFGSAVYNATTHTRNSIPISCSQG